MTTEEINEKFRDACRNGDLNAVKELLKDSRINPADNNNRAIRYASQYGHLEVVKLLLEDQRVNPSDWDNWAIVGASEYGHLEVVKLLLKDQRVNPSNWAIVWASENGHFKVVRELLKDQRVDPSDVRNRAIRWASGDGHLEVVRELLKDPRVDPSDLNNCSIKSASHKGHLEVVRELLKDERVKNGEDLENVKKKYPELFEEKMTTEEINEKFKDACRNGDLEVVKELLKDPRVDPSVDNNWAIRCTSENGHFEVVKELLKDPRVDPSDRSNYAIRWSSENGHFEVVKLLLEDERVDPSDLDNYAIQWASENGHLEVARELLKDQRVDPSADNNYAIRLASYNGYLKVVKSLLEHVEVDPSDWENRAIQGASHNGHLEVVRELLKDQRVRNGGDLASVRKKYPELFQKEETLTVEEVNKKFRNACRDGELEIAQELLKDERVDPSYYGIFAIGWASENGHPEVIKMLLGDARVDPSADSNCSIRLASHNGHLEVVKLLLSDERVDPSDLDNYAIRWASEKGHIEVVKLLLEGERVRNGGLEFVKKKYPELFQEDNISHSEEKLESKIQQKEVTEMNHLYKSDKKALNLVEDIRKALDDSSEIKDLLNEYNAELHKDLEIWFLRNHPDACDFSKMFADRIESGAERSISLFNYLEHFDMRVYSENNLVISILNSPKNVILSTNLYRKDNDLIIRGLKDLLNERISNKLEKLTEFIDSNKSLIKAEKKLTLWSGVRLCIKTLIVILGSLSLSDYGLKTLEQILVLFN